MSSLPAKSGLQLNNKYNSGDANRFTANLIRIRKSFSAGIGWRGDRNSAVFCATPNLVPRGTFGCCRRFHGHFGRRRVIVFAVFWCFFIKTPIGILGACPLPAAVIKKMSVAAIREALAVDHFVTTVKPNAASASSAAPRHLSP